MALEQGQLEEAAAFLFHLRVQRETTTQLPFEIAPRSLDDAYAIQDALHAAAGWPIGVLKVGCTSELAQQFLGIPHPIGGRIPTEGVFDSGVAIPRSFFCTEPAIECEIAMQVDDDGQIVAVAPALELINARVQASGNFGGMSTVADNSAGCAVVLGRPTPVADAGNLADYPIELSDDSAVLATGTAAAVIGGPAASVEWTHSHEQSRGRSVAGGTWIITGTCTGLTPTAWGGNYRASFGDLGDITFSLGA